MIKLSKLLALFFIGSLCSVNNFLNSMTNLEVEFNNINKELYKDSELAKQEIMHFRDNARNVIAPTKFPKWSELDNISALLQKGYAVFTRKRDVTSMATGEGKPHYFLTIINKIPGLESDFNPDQSYEDKQNSLFASHVPLTQENFSKMQEIFDSHGGMMYGSTELVPFYQVQDIALTEEDAKKVIGTLKASIKPKPSYISQSQPQIQQTSPQKPAEIKVTPQSPIIPTPQSKKRLSIGQKVAIGSGITLVSMAIIVAAIKIYKKIKEERVKQNKA